MGIIRWRLHFPSPTLIIACLALFAALGGRTYAATSSSGIRFTKATLENGWFEYGGLGTAPAGLQQGFARRRASARQDRVQ